MSDRAVPSTRQPAADPLSSVVALFASQHGVASDLQIRRLGVSWRRQQTLIRNGLWQRRSPGVVASGGSPTSWHQRAMAATLSPGTNVFLTGAAAARLHRLDGFTDIERIIVLIADNRRIRVSKDVTVNRSRVLTAQDATIVDGIPVTTIPVTLVHLMMYGLRADQALDSALRMGVAPDELRRVFERWRRCGVHGPRELSDMLQQRVGARLPRSWFQVLAGRLLEAEGIHLVDEWPVRGARNRLLAELDLADVDLQVGVECQSWEWHGSTAAQDKDLKRKRTLRRLGWDIIDLWWSDLERMDDIVTDIRLALDRARARRAAESLTA